jgi:hypothetical protein
MPLAGGPIFALSSGYAAWLDDTRAQWRWPTDSHRTATVIAGTETETQPIDEHPATTVGKHAYGFAMLDWYNRIHVYPRTNDMGNVIANQTVIVRVWNSYFTNRSLIDIGETDTEGLLLDKPRPDPTILQPLEMLAYAITVQTDGPPNIDATYTFDFDVIDVTVTFTGSRVVPWLWIPSGEVLERLEWLTDVIEAYNGTEQRQQLRVTPRRFFEFDLLLEGLDRRKAEAAIYGWGGRVFALPLWMDGTELGSPVAAGMLTFPLEVSGRDYHDDGLAMIIDGTDYEVLTIESVGLSSLILLREVTRNWSSTARIYPLRTARIDGDLMMRRFTGDSMYGRARFRCTDASEYTAATETTYASYPILTESPNWSEDISQEYTRLMSVFDAGICLPFYEDRAGVARVVQLHRKTATNRSEISALRAWLYARRGRYGAIWLPTWAKDIVVVATIANTALTIDVENQNLTTQLNAAIGKRDIRIQLNSGAVYYRRINGVSMQTSTVERLSISSALGITIQPSEIALVSFMSLARLDSDAVELRWWKHDVVEAAFNLRGLTNDV